MAKIPAIPSGVPQSSEIKVTGTLCIDTIPKDTQAEGEAFSGLSIIFPRSRLLAFLVILFRDNMGDVSTAERPRIVIFGPQTALPDVESLSRLRLVLLSEPLLSSFLEAIQDLPEIWHLLVKTFPKFEAVPGLRVLESLKIWIQSGQDFPHAQIPLPNVLLASLTVIMQIANYAHYLRVVQVQDSQVTHQDLLKELEKGGVQGLCIGVLSAIAMASSETKEDLGAYGAVALRLAVCIGAVVDLDGAFASPPNEASCFTIRYGEKGKDLAQEILQQFPDVSFILEPAFAFLADDALISKVIYLCECGFLASYRYELKVNCVPPNATHVHFWPGCQAT